MQKNKGILDDLDIENKKELGTNLQLLRGFIISAIAQLLIWFLFFKGIYHAPDRVSDFIYSPIINIDFINYRMNAVAIIAYAGLILGASLYSFSSNAANQPYRKLLLLGLILSALATINLYLARSIVLNNEFIEIMNHIPEAIFMAIFYFIILIGVIFLFKKKSWYIAAIFFLIVLLLIGFIP